MLPHSSTRWRQLTTARVSGSCSSLVHTRRLRWFGSRMPNKCFKPTVPSSPGRQLNLGVDMVFMRSALLIAIALAALSASPAGPDNLSFQFSSSLSPSVMRVLENDEGAERYALVAHVNPFYLHGDSNGDGRTDTAVLVKNKVSGQLGIAIVHSGAKSAIIVGAGCSVMVATTSDGWMPGIFIPGRRLTAAPMKGRHRPLEATRSW